MNDAGDLLPHQQIFEQAGSAGNELPTEPVGADQHKMMALLQKRSIAMAQRPTNTSPQLIEVLRFNIGNEKYAIESCYVDQVLPIQHITALFNLPPFMRGICYVSGKVVSVVDLRLLFQLPGSGLNDRNLLLVIRHQQMEFGLLADAIVGIQMLDLAGLQKSLPNLDHIRTRYLQGITREQCVLLDGLALLTDPELIVSQEAI